MKARIDFYCVGAQKAGTTSLHHFLARHPAVFLPRIKETHFFNNGHGEYAKGVDYYLSRYFGDAPPGAMKGEIDPEYMFFPEVPERLHAAFPEAKLIFVLRDPVSRAYSHYLMSRRRGYERMSFEEAIEAEPGRLRMGDVQTRSDFSYIERGYYFRQIAGFLEYFPRERMLFLFSDELKVRPEAVLEQVYAFLGLPLIPYEPVRDEESNLASAPRSWFIQNLVSGDGLGRKLGGLLLPAAMKGRIWNLVEKHNRRPIMPGPLAPETLAYLRSLYAQDLADLAGLVKRDLSDWGART